MAKAQIADDVWVRRIHDSWANARGWRTDIPKTVLDDLSVKRALFILDDTRGVIVPMDELRRVLAGVRLRPVNNVVGPFNVNPHNSTVNDVPVTVEIKMPRAENASEPVKHEPSSGPP